MRHCFFQIHDERGTNEDPVGAVLSDPSAAMLRAVTICAETGCSCRFFPGFAVSVRNEDGAVIGRVSVVLATATLEHRNV